MPDIDVRIRDVRIREEPVLGTGGQSAPTKTSKSPVGYEVLISALAIVNGPAGEVAVAAASPAYWPCLFT